MYACLVIIRIHYSDLTKSGIFEKISRGYWVSYMWDFFESLLEPKMLFSVSCLFFQQPASWPVGSICHNVCLSVCVSVRFKQKKVFFGGGWGGILGFPLSTYYLYCVPYKAISLFPWNKRPRRWTMCTVWSLVKTIKAAGHYTTINSNGGSLFRITYMRPCNHPHRP